MNWSGRARTCSRSRTDSGVSVRKRHDRRRSRSDTPTSMKGPNGTRVLRSPPLHGNDGDADHRTYDKRGKCPDEQLPPSQPAEIEADHTGQLHVAEAHSRGVDEPYERVEARPGRPCPAAPARRREGHCRPTPRCRAALVRSGTTEASVRPEAAADRCRSSRARRPSRRGRGRPAGRRGYRSAARTRRTAQPWRARRAGIGSRSGRRSFGTGHAGSATTPPGCCPGARSGCRTTGSAMPAARPTPCAGRAR